MALINPDPIALPGMLRVRAALPTLRNAPGCKTFASVEPRPEHARVVRIIGCNNGMGLSCDREIVAAAFREAGWGVIFAEQRDRTNAVVGVNVHLEQVAAALLEMARVNVIIPNPEWWEPSWTALLRDPSVFVWAKSQDAVRLFRQFGATVEPIGFHSLDHRDEAAKRERAFLHIAGASPNKGTSVLLSCWKEDWPRLTVVSSREVKASAQKNVTVIRGRIEDAEVRQLQNSHAFHLYPSRYEGFGHAQWEGLSCGAVVFATNGPPFDEHQEAFRLLGAKLGERRIATKRDVTTEAIAAAVDWAQALSEEELVAHSDKSRRAWESSGAAFGERIRQSIGKLDAKALTAPAAPRAGASGLLADLPPLVYVGRVDCVTGQGTAARHQIHVLRKHGLRLRIVEAGSCASPDPHRRDPLVQAARTSDPDITKTHGTLIHLQPNTAEMFHTDPHQREAYPRPHILVSVWETTKIPAAWVPLINSYDQAWCATEWQRDVYLASGVRPEILRVVPFAIDPALFDRVDKRPRASKSRVILGSVFQWSERKDPVGLIGTFLRTFTAEDPVTLLLKSYEGDRPTTDVSARVSAIIRSIPLRHRRPNIEVISRAMTGDDMADFYKSIDCYVSAHRGEGWSFPLTEALLSGRPVIATGWSAPAEYAAGLFRPVSYTLEPPHGMDWQPFYSSDQRWAQANLGDLARAMREATMGRIPYSAELLRARFESLVKQAGERAAAALGEVLK